MSDFPRYKIIQKPFVEPSTKLFIRQVIQTLDLLNKVVSNVNYLRSLVETNSSQIVLQNSYSNVLEPIVKLEYLDDLQYYFFIQNIPDSLAEIPNLPFSLFSWKKYFNIQSTLVKDLQGNLKPTTITSYEKSYNAFINVPGAKTKDYFYTLYFDLLDNVLSLNFAVWKKDLLNPSRYISIGSSNLDLVYISATPDITNIPAELKNLIRYVNLELEYLQLTDFDSTTNTTIYSYTPDALLTTRCLLSTEFPQWTGQLLLDCFIPDSNESIYKRVTNLITEINQANKVVKEDYYVFASYTLNNIFYISIIKFVDFEFEFAIKEYKININDFLLKVAPINNDLVIKGGLEVSDIIKMNTYDNVISFNSKIGVNQSLQEINGYIDVDSLGLAQITGLLEGFSLYENYSSDTIFRLGDDYDEANVFLTLQNLNLLEKIFVFTSPVLVTITPSDITFVYVPDFGILENRRFSEESFKKIQTIVNEVFRMKDVISLNSGYVFTFIEILNDTKYNYLCSLKATLTNGGNTINFVSSFQLVNIITTDPSYEKQFRKIISNLSSATRLLNYSQFVIRIPAIQNELDLGNSIDSFTAFINASTLNRFGNKNLRVQAYQLKTVETPNEIPDRFKIFPFYFTENFPPWNLRFPESLYIEGTEFNVLTSLKQIIDKYTKLFGYASSRVGINNILTYAYGFETQIGTINIIDLGTEGEPSWYLINVYLTTEEYLTYNLQSSGDNLIKGNMIVSNINNKKVFQTSSVSNSISTLYKMGVGTEEPDTTIELEDTSLQDVLNYFDGYAQDTNLLDWNIDKITDDVDLATIVDTFTIPYTSIPFVQSNNRYFFIFELNDDGFGNLRAKDSIVRYHFLYPSWIGEALGNIFEPNNEQIIKLCIANQTIYFNKFSYYENSTYFTTLDWVFGRKGSWFRSFIYKGNVCFIGIGQNFFNQIQYNTNDNVANLYNNIEFNSVFIQWIQSKVATPTNPDPPLNFPAFERYWQLLVTRNDTKKTSFLSYDIYPDDADSIEYAVNFVDGEREDGKPIVELDFNQFSRAKDLIKKFKKIYNNGQKNPVFVKNNYSGIFRYEDLFNDYFCVFWVSNVDIATGIITIYLCEVNILSVYKYSCTLGSDLSVTGNLIVRKKGEIINLVISPNFVNIDPDALFFGIGTDIRGIIYPNEDPLTKTGTTSSQFFIVSNNTYPIAVFQRTDVDVLVKPNYFFGSISSATINRKTNEDDTNKIYEKANIYGTLYGTDISFEFSTDSFTEPAGYIGIYIDSVEEGKANCGFNVQVAQETKTVDSLLPGDDKLFKRSIFLVDNNGKITLNNGKLIQYPSSFSEFAQFDFYIDTQVGQITMSQVYTEAQTITLYLFNKLLVPTSVIAFDITQGDNCTIENVVLEEGKCQFDLVITGNTTLPPRINFFISIIQENSLTDEVTLDNPFGYITMFSPIPSATTVKFALNNTFITKYSFISISVAECDNITSALATKIIQGQTVISITTEDDTVTAPQIRFMIMN